MVVGFNHNFSYKGQVYHVQTEDSGIKNPHIITLLYRGGTILSSKKTSYADIIKVDNLEAVVEDLMKTQHREMLRMLKNGDFDELLGLPPERTTPAAKGGVSAPPATEKIPFSPSAPPLAAPPVSAAPTVAAAPPAAAPQAAAAANPPPAPSPPPSQAKKTADPSPAPAALSLDDIILSYMVGDDRKK